MKISRIFQLLPVLAFGIMCCLLLGCAKKCIVPRPTLACAENGLLYKPDAGIAGVTQIKLTVSDATTNALILDTLLAPGGSLLIPSSALASPVLVVSEYLSASGRPVARDEQILDGLCRTAIVTMDVVINRPSEYASLCEQEANCDLPPNSTTTYTFSWPTSTDPIKKIRVGSVSFLVRLMENGTVEVIPCSEHDAFTEDESKGALVYTSRTNTDAFSLTFTPNQNSTTGNVTINLTITSPSAGLPACIN